MSIHIISLNIELPFPMSYYYNMVSSTRIFNEYYEAVYDTNRDQALFVIDKALEDGAKPEDIVFKVVVPTIEKMLSELVDSEGATLSQHYICSKVSAEITDKMIPLFKKQQKNRGTIVLGTARGDFHGLGKKIVAGCLKANMYEVYDLGINVSPEIFVDEAVRLKASIIGVSSMMVHTTIGEQGAAGVLRILEERGLHGQIKLIVGGAPYRFDHELYRIVGADDWSENAIEAVRVVDKLMKEKVES